MPASEIRGFPFSQALRQFQDRNRRWIIVGACLFYVIVIWCPYAGFAVFRQTIAKDLGWDAGSTSVAYSIVVFMGAPLGLLIGRLLDTMGPRRLALAGAGFFCASFLLASTIRNIWQLYLYFGILLGAGFAGAYIIPTFTAARWFRENRGLAIGLVLSGQGLAYTVGPVLSNWLIESIGWRNALLILGVGVGVLGIVPSLVMRNPPADASPWAAESGPATVAGSPQAPAASFTWLQAVSTTTFWLLWFVWVFQAFAQMMFTIHVIPLLSGKGIAPMMVAGALSIYGAGLLAGRLILGPASDRFGARSIMGSTTVLAALGLMVLLLGQELPILYGAAFAFGVAYGGADTAYVRALPEIVGVGLLGTLMSFLNLGFRVGGTIGPSFAGFVVDATHSYTLPYVISAVLVLASGGLFLAAARPQMQLERKINQKKLATLTIGEEV